MRRVDQRENSIINKSTESEKGNLVEERAIHRSIETESGFTGTSTRRWKRIWVRESQRSARNPEHISHLNNFSLFSPHGIIGAEANRTSGRLNDFLRSLD